jgi:hypothetical protein
MMAYLQMQQLLGLLLLLVTVSQTVLGLDATDTITSAGMDFFLSEERRYTAMANIKFSAM